MKKSGLFVLLLFALSQFLWAQKTDSLRVDSNTCIYKLTDFIYEYISYKEVPSFGQVAANGMLIIVDRKAVLVDTPWDDERTDTLCRFIQDSLKARIIMAIVTHAHDDRIGGIAHLKRAEIPVYASEMTTMEAKKAGIPRPDIIFNDSLSVNFNGVEVLMYYPGAGHAPDNIMVWVPVERVLYGGCFLRSNDANSLGSMATADPQAWLKSIENAIKRFPEALIVIPGHGKLGGLEILPHTQKLLKEFLEPDQD